MSTILQSQGAALGCFVFRETVILFLFLFACCAPGSESSLGGFPKVRANSDVQAPVGDGHVATLDVQKVERDTSHVNNLIFTLFPQTPGICGIV